jgi:hypothetical protein
MTMSLKDHRRKAKLRRQLAALHEQALVRARNQIMNGFFGHHEDLTRTIDQRVSDLGEPIRIDPMPARTFDLRLVQYQVVHYDGLPEPWPWQDQLAVYGQKAAVKLAQYIIDNGLMRRLVNHIPNQRITTVSWEAMIGRERREG